MAFEESEPLGHGNYYFYHNFFLINNIIFHIQKCVGGAFSTFSLYQKNWYVIKFSLLFVIVWVISSNSAISNLILFQIWYIPVLWGLLYGIHVLLDVQLMTSCNLETHFITTRQIIITTTVILTHVIHVSQKKQRTCISAQLKHIGIFSGAHFHIRL